MKIDRSLISQIDTDDESLEVVKTIVAIAHELNINMIATGVETARQVAQLKTLKCEYGQGYFFSKPLDTEAARLLIGAQLTMKDGS